MNEPHRNVALLQKVNPGNITESADFFSEDVVWHFYNLRLPELAGDYVGLQEIQAFFETMSKQTAGAFRVEPVGITPVGDELVVVQTVNTIVFGSSETKIDVVVVWRIVDGLVTEVWDIPSVHSLHSS